MKLAEIAARIDKHLDRFANDPEISSREWTDSKGVVRRNTLFWHPCAFRAGSYVHVKYVRYQSSSSLRRYEALAYLAWLDAGNIGTHYECQRLACTSAPLDA